MSTVMPNRSSFRSLLGEFVRLVQAWWRADRIRVSPNAGRLLRIAPRCVISVQGQAATVVTRTVSQGPSGSRVSYQCDNCAGRARLCVEVGPRGGITRVIWIESSREIPLSEDEVEVWG